MSSLQVSKVLNNNVIIAEHPQHGEVVVIGKGIGFNRKTGQAIPLAEVEKMFILTKPEEQEQYKQLLPQVDEKLIEAVNEILLHADQTSSGALNEHVHIALTDHIAFAIKRMQQGIHIHNPFLYETKEMYPEEFRMAEFAVRLIHQKLGVDLGEEEAGFIALHIHGALTNQHISEVRKHSELISDLVHIVETEMYVLLIRSGMSKPVDLGCFPHYWGNLTLSGRDQDPERILMPFWYLQNLSRKQDDPHAANV
ncbi:PRD domain-containing protein [Paenibacillus sp. AR247]|uniref:PRD domain-containing protein n=1 Tax=Paenibacillus sp. AR247 TaxID=1631599 RepID=UPI000CF9744E|nr:PRD domain-containing protein [Paenibacillus sp. AR247]PQP87504.1 PtsGHI operon antiterminator [Paenibacillus sp. AR247]